jgi:hypothetical protein
MMAGNCPKSIHIMSCYLTIPEQTKVEKKQLTPNLFEVPSTGQIDLVVLTYTAPCLAL